MALGIKETFEVQNFLLGVGQSIHKSLEDGKFEISDSLHFVTPLMLLQPALADIKQVPAELKDLDMVEGMQLVDNVIAKLPGLSAKHIKIIKASLKLVLDGVELYHAIKE